MNEREPQTNEHLTGPRSAELEQIAAEIQSHQPERPAESAEAKQERVEAARAEIEHQAETAASAAETTKPEPAKIITRFDKIKAYRHTMASLQKRLRPASRSFSRLIHTPVVEKTSEVVGQTVLRPSATLGATLTALVVGGFMYLTARRYGYALQGSELLIALAVGAVIGLAIEQLLLLIRRFRRR